MKIYVDNREQGLYMLLSQDVNLEMCAVEIKQHDIGDITICDDENNILLLFERKTQSDLASSIVDGRYKEQSYRLNACDVPNHNIIYIIEDSKLHKTAIDEKTLKSAMVSLQYYKGFSVYSTKNIKDTSKFIWSFAEKIAKEKNVLGYYNGGDIEKYNFMNVQKSAKKGGEISVENIGALMLMQIPKVSANIADSIMEKYKSLISLIVALQENENVLLETTFTKKPNKPCIENIKHFLLYDD